MKVIAKDKDYYDNIYSQIDNQTDEKTVYFKREQESFMISQTRFRKGEVEVKKKSDGQEVELSKETQEKMKLFYKKVMAKMEMQGISEQDFRNSFINNRLMLWKHDSKDKLMLKPKFLFYAGKVKVLYDIMEKEKISYANYTINEWSFTGNVTDNPLEYLKDNDLLSKDESYLNNLKKAKRIETLDFSDEMVIAQAPLVIIKPQRSPVVFDANLKVIINPNLLKEKIEKFIDPYTMHQELEVFIGQQLTYRDIPEPPSNDIKIEAHGFDLKTSFRKPSQGRKK